ncbi:MAG: hypothetical protein FJX62_10630 [Alphaproteobacteria bacterium]|nr:hypothetical protein [Alphaproteobacteria bacterium]
MAGVQVRRFGVMKQISYWQYAELRRERSKQVREQAKALSDATNTAFANAGHEHMQAAGELAAKAALKRIAAETEAKFQKADQEKSRNSIQIWKNKEPPTSIKAGGSDIDLSAGILTLSDGTRIDLKTGSKVVADQSNYLTLADGSRIDLRTGHKVINIVA